MKKLMLYFAAFALAANGAANALAQSSGDCSSPTTAYPGGVGVRNITTNAATIHWNAVPGAKGYAISVGAADIDAKTWPTYLACKPQEMTYTVAGLVPGKTYRARVRALCETCFRSFGPSVTQWSQEVEFTTLSGAENQNPQGPTVPTFPVLIQDPTQQPSDYVINWPGKPNPPNDPDEPNEPVDGRYTMAGYVIDAWHRPVASARVKRGSVETLTDAKGRFVLTVHETRPAATTPVLVVVEKEGYWRNASRQYLHAQDTTETMLMLREQTVTNRVDAKKGGEMLYKRFTLQLPPNGVQTEDGTLYTGTILLSVDGATPSERDFGLRMPGGDFAAIDANNNYVMLYSYGFLSAEMTTESGQKLEFRPGAEATLRFNLPHTETHRPDSVPLWHFNETTAIWEQEGWSVKNGSIYEGRVRHFSSWNCDIPAERGTVKGRVIDCNDQPIKNGRVNIGQRRIYSDVNGGYWSWVPGGLIFDVSTHKDTLADISVPAMQERELEDLEGFDFDGLGVWDPRTKLLNVHVSGNVPGNLRLSIDGGQTWTQQREWTDVSAAPAEILLEGACTDLLRVVVQEWSRDCRKLSSSEARNQQFFSLQNAYTSNAPVYILSIDPSITEVQRAWVDHFPCVHTLYALNVFSNNRLPENIGDLSSLQSLVIADGALAELPESFTNLRSLESFAIMSNPMLRTLPERFGDLSNLYFLGIDRCGIETLPESIGNLRNLQSLDMPGNKISELPESFRDLSSLIELNLSNNQISVLPESVVGLSQLRTLRLFKNQLTDLPASIANLADTLQSLDLGLNPIPTHRRGEIQAMLPNTYIQW